MKLEICSFTGYKIHPGHGKIYVRIDNRTFRFIDHKSESLFLQRLNPRKIHWTQLFRRMRKKGITEEQAKKRTRRTVKHQRAIVGASIEQLRAKRNQKPEVREAQRLAAIEAAKKKKQEEATKKAEKKVAAGVARPKAPKKVRQQGKGGKPVITPKSR